MWDKNLYFVSCRIYTTKDIDVQNVLKDIDDNQPSFLKCYNTSAVPHNSVEQFVYRSP